MSKGNGGKDAKLFFGGVPTEPDVKKLHEAFGVPDRGAVVSHSEIAAVIGVYRDESRYWTVVNRWRKDIEQEHGIVSDVDPGNAVEFLTDERAFDFGLKKRRSAIRVHWRHNTIIHLVRAEKLGKAARDRLDHTRTSSALEYQGMMENSRQMRLKPVRQESLPKPTEE